MFYCGNPNWLSAEARAALKITELPIKESLAEERASAPISDPLGEASDWGDLSDNDTAIAASLLGQAEKNIAPIGTNDLPEDWD